LQETTLAALPGILAISPFLADRSFLVPFAAHQFSVCFRPVSGFAQSRSYAVTLAMVTGM
jgi:hypothetical protein